LSLNEKKIRQFSAIEGLNFEFLGRYSSIALAIELSTEKVKLPARFFLLDVFI